jgi:alpha/beta hydrolase family protein
LADGQEGRIRVEDRHYTITLIHGTFANQTPWIQPGSLLRRTLETGLGGRVAFASFAWDGENDQDSRRRASGRLAKHVRALAAARPETCQVIVAHSHGGNIALQAAPNPAVAEGVSSLVCMSTPVFHPSPRDILMPALALVRTYAWFFGMTVLTFVAAYALFPRFRFYDGLEAIRSTFDLVRWGAAAGVAVGIAVGLTWTHGRIARWIAQRQKRRISGLGPPEGSKLPVLCFWARGDEVLLGFRLADRLAGLSVLLLRPWSIAAAFAICLAWMLPYGRDAIQGFKTFGMEMFAIVVYSFYPFAVLAQCVSLQLRIDIAPGQPIATAIMTLVAVTVLSTVSLVAALFGHVVLKLLPFGMNHWRFVDTFFLRIAPATAPRGAFDVTLIEADLPRSGGLMHCSVYANAAALEKIVAFIKSKADKQGQRPSPGPEQGVPDNSRANEDHLPETAAAGNRISLG